MRRRPRCSWPTVGSTAPSNVARLSAAGVRWISRVPDTSKEARAALQVADDAWQQEDDAVLGARRPQAPAGERWVVVRTTQGEERARATLERQVEQTRAAVGAEPCGIWATSASPVCPMRGPPSRQQLKKCPAWLQVQSVLVMQPKHRRPGRPRKDVPPDQVEWQILATLSVDEAAVTREVRRKAAFLVATNVLDPAQLSDQELIQTYKDQHSVERGLQFSQRSAVSGLLGLREEARAHRGAQSGDGAVSAGLPAGRAPATRAARRHRTDHPQPAQATN